MNGRILIEDLRVRAIAGVYPHERKFPRTLLLTIELELDLRNAARKDELDSTLDYDWLCRRIRRQVRGARRLTLEAVAGDVLEICLENPIVHAASVRVDKPGAVAGSQTVAVELEVRRDED